jgi:hypothetical protein
MLVKTITNPYLSSGDENSGKAVMALDPALALDDWYFGRRSFPLALVRHAGRPLRRLRARTGRELLRKRTNYRVIGCKRRGGHIGTTDPLLRTPDRAHPHPTRPAARYLWDEMTSYYQPKRPDEEVWADVDEYLRSCLWSFVPPDGPFGNRSGCFGSLPRSRQYSSRCQSENRIAAVPRTMTNMVWTPIFYDQPRQGDVWDNIPHPEDDQERQ